MRDTYPADLAVSIRQQRSMGPCSPPIHTHVLALRVSVQRQDCNAFRRVDAHTQIRAHDQSASGAVFSSHTIAHAAVLKIL